MKNKSKEEKVRERILFKGYGKFDLVEDILTKEEILNLKPRIVLKNITERLSLPEDKINRKTFWSWLRRYRQSKSVINFYPGKKRSIKEPTVNPDDDPVKPMVDQAWLKDFRPSLPKNRSQTPVVIKVIRSGNNSQKHESKI